MTESTPDLSVELSADYDKAMAAAEVFMAALADTSAGRKDGVTGKVALAINALHQTAYREDNTKPMAFLTGLSMGLTTIFAGGGVKAGLVRKTMGRLTDLVVKNLTLIARRQAEQKADAA